MIKRVIQWICNQNYTKAQLQDITWSQLATIANNLNLDIESPGALKKKIKPYKNTIMNTVWSDWRKKRIEAARVILEAKVHEYDPDAVVVYAGQSDEDATISRFSVDVDLNLEKT